MKRQISPLSLRKNFALVKKPTDKHFNVATITTGYNEHYNYHLD